MNKLFLISWNILVIVVGLLYLLNPKMIDPMTVRCVGAVIIIDGLYSIYYMIKRKE